MKTISVFLYVEMELLFKDQKNAKILIIFHMMVAINVYCNVQIIVIITFQEFVMHLIKVMILDQQDDIQYQRLIKKITLKTTYNINYYVEMEYNKIKRSLMMGVNQVLMVVQVYTNQKKIEIAIQITIIVAFQKLKFSQNIAITPININMSNYQFLICKMDF